MSDSPKLAPPDTSDDAPALDDIILGEDDQTVPSPPVAYRPSASPPRSAANHVQGEPAKEARKRAKMTLRIPDDEVSRPQLPAATPLGGVPVHGSTRPPSNPDLPGGRQVSSPDPAEIAAPPLRPQRIISVGAADDTLELPALDLEARGGQQHPVAARAPGIDNTHEAGWTPYQPTVADRGAGQDAAPPGVVRDLARTMIDGPGMGALAAMRHGEEPPPPSDDIPVDTDDEETLARDPSDDALTYPRLPTALDSEDIKLEEVERVTDPGEVSEIETEDLVSVESIPVTPHAPPLLKAGKASTPSPPVVTATSLMSGAGGPAAPPTLSAPLPAAHGAATPSAQGGPRSPSVPAPPTVPTYAPPSGPTASQPQPQAPLPLHAPPSEAESPLAEQFPTAGTPMARRQQPAGGPFGFMPPVGALAPPPMNEAAANRKKTRPWWEDLFNDDFIRTMAKITDADIAREANFIEESLGCEAGATILDLACGTGRHAVELATRGYQVVGFDLSLAMLARASDEAQDRHQKINFVQGDMREMTFEETFDGIFSWNTSFGYFDEEKNNHVIAKVHRALKKGGQFLLDVVNRDNLVRQAPSLAWFEGDGCICMDEMHIDFITSRMKVKRTLMMDDGRTKEIEYSIRVYSLHELGKMLHDNGFRVAEVSGRTGTPGVFFGCESPRTLILAEKR